MPSKGETECAWQIQASGNPHPVEEYRFHPTRRWRFDFAWPDRKLAVEIEGGTYSGGRHTRGGGFEKDCENYAEAMLLGWKVLRFTTKMVNSGYALNVTEAMLKDSDKNAP